MVTTNLVVEVRHSFTTRMLLTCIRSKLYWHEQTTDDIFAEIARQACELFTTGVQESLTELKLGPFAFLIMIYSDSDIYVL